MAEKEKNNENFGKIEKNTSKSEKDFESWLRIDEQRNHEKVQGALNELRADIEQHEKEKHVGSKKTGEIDDLSKEKISPPHRQEGSVFSDHIVTRKSDDIDKSVIQGVAQSVIAPLRAVVDGVGDLGRLILSPRREIRRTITYLEQESSAKII